MKDILVEVTAQDVLLGTPKCPFKCPVATAVNRHLKEGFEASVGRTTLHVAAKGKNTVHDSIKLPPEVIAFINYFDWDHGITLSRVAPLSFKLTFDERVLR